MTLTVEVVFSFLASFSGFVISVGTVLVKVGKQNERLAQLRIEHDEHKQRTQAQQERITLLERQGDVRDSQMRNIELQMADLKAGLNDLTAQTGELNAHLRQFLRK